MKHHQLAFSSISSPQVSLKTSESRYALYKSTKDLQAASLMTTKNAVLGQFSNKSKGKARISEVGEGKFGEKGKGKVKYGLEERLIEELKQTKDSSMEIESEISSIRRIFQSVIDHSPEFRTILDCIRYRYEELLLQATNEADLAQDTVQRVFEERKVLLMRVDALSRAQSMTPQISSISPKLIHHSRNSPTFHMPNLLSYPPNLDSTERRNARQARKEEIENSESSEDMEFITDKPAKSFRKPGIVPKLRLDLVKGLLESDSVPKLKRKTRIIEII